MPTRETADDFLPLCPWDVERWFASDTYLRAPLAVQGAYLNLCFAAWRRQPSLIIPNDDAILARLAGARSPDEWTALRPCVLAVPWELRDAGWWHPIVAEVYADASERYRRSVAAGRIAGRASARVRRERSKMKEAQEVRTTVERPLNDRATNGQPTNVKQKRSSSRQSVPSVVEALSQPDERNGLVPLPRDETFACKLVFEYWRTATHHERAQLTDERMRYLKVRLREEPGDLAAKVAGLKLAVDGAARDGFFNGTETGRSYLDFENVFVHKGRNRIEKLQRLAAAPEQERDRSLSGRIDEKVAASVRRSRDAAALVRQTVQAVKGGGKG